jgi:hypothetical protein
VWQRFAYKIVSAVVTTVFTTVAGVVVRHLLLRKLREGDEQKQLPHYRPQDHNHREE